MSLSTEQRQQMTMRLREMRGASHDANELPGERITGQQQITGHPFILGDVGNPLI